MSCCKWECKMISLIQSGLFFLLAFQLLGYDMWPMNFSPELTLPIRVTGVFLGITAVSVIVWTKWIRRKSWSDPMVPPGQVVGHQLFTHGSYQWVRHPFYVASLLLVLALELLLVSWMSVVIMPLLVARVIYMAKVEERQLEAHYGQAYIAYKRKSWRLLPYVY